VRSDLLRHLRAAVVALTGLAVLAVPTVVAPAASSVPSSSSVRADPADRSTATATEPAARKRRCVDAGKRFRPTSLGIEGVTRAARVLHLGRDGANVPKAPPLSSSGKRLLAWDAQDAIRAGARRGVAKLNAHTYPDGSALGNDLINRLQVGDRLTARGSSGQVRCYRVVDRVQITAERRYARYYRTDGPHRLAIAVCSGVRRGPGDWSHRTLWFAKRVR
jgi:hypothetical protein